MNRSALIWTIVVVLAGGWLAFRAASQEMAKVYVRTDTVTPEGSDKSWTKSVEVFARERNEANISLSLPRTIGMWIAAFGTLGIMSFLWGDNVFYKVAEAIVVGASAAYAMVVYFWTGIVQNLFGNLAPDLMRRTLIPGTPETEEFDPLYIIPLIFGVMMLMRLLPKGGWISRWPLAFFIGFTSGIKLVGFLDADFVRQIQSTVLSFVVMTDGNFDWRASLKNITIVVGVSACLVYFFFSVEHKGIVGGIARLGIWFLMITFGAGFGYTVMGRIALISERLKFLFDDWLWIIDPVGRRIGM